MTEHLVRNVILTVGGRKTRGKGKGELTRRKKTVIKLVVGRKEAKTVMRSDRTGRGTGDGSKSGTKGVGHFTGI